MKTLDISITKAAIEGFTVTSSNGKPSVSATIALLTEGGKKITTYSASTYTYDDAKKLKLPIEVFPLLGKAAMLIEKSIVKHCKDSQLGLSSGDLDDGPIDLSNIPF